MGQPLASSPDSELYVPLFGGSSAPYVEDHATVIFTEGLRDCITPEDPVMISPLALATLGRIAKTGTVYVDRADQEMLSRDNRFRGLAICEPQGVGFSVDMRQSVSAFYISATELLEMAKKTAETRSSPERPISPLDAKVLSFTLTREFWYAYTAKHLSRRQTRSTRDAFTGPPALFLDARLPQSI